MFSLAQSLAQNDKVIFNIINHNFVNHLFDKLMPFLTTIGNIGAIWLLIAVGLFLFGGKKGRRVALLVFFTGIASDLVTEVFLKNMFMRPRPFTTLQNVRLLVPKPASFSFPSGHATISFASGLILARNYRPFRWLFLILALGIAYSRVYVGVHFPLDVLAGSIIGIALASLILRKQQRIENLMDEVRERYFHRQKTKI